MENILQNIKLIQQRIAKACAKVGRKPEEVKLLLATKTVTPERIKIALEDIPSLQKIKCRNSKKNMKL